MRRVAWWLILLLVLANGIVGLLNGPRDWLEAENGKERLLAFSVTVYGIAGMITFPGLLMRRRWVMIPMILWAITTAFAGT